MRPVFTGFYENWGKDRTSTIKQNFIAEFDTLASSMDLLSSIFTKEMYLTKRKEGCRHECGT